MTTSNIILSLINEVAIYFLVFLLLFTVNGFGRALFAKMLGDSTMQEDGFLTLNPLAHVNVLGLMIILLFLSLTEFILGGGLFRGAAYIFIMSLGVYCSYQGVVNRYNFKNERIGSLIFAFSKTITFIVVAFLALLCLYLCTFKFLPSYVIITLSTFLNMVIDITLFWAIAELLPIPPFEVGNALRYIVPNSLLYVVDFLEENSLFILFFLLFVPGISNLFFGGIWRIASMLKLIMIKVLF